MAKRTVLEELVVLVTGDFTAYARTVKSIEKITKQASAMVRQQTARMNAFMKSQFLNPMKVGLGNLFTPMIAGANQARLAMTAMFGAMRVQAAATKRALSDMFARSPLGKGLYNARIGLMSGWHNLPPVGMGMMRRFSTRAGRMGFGIGQFGNRAFQFQRNFRIGASAGWAGVPFMNRMGRVIPAPTWAHGLGQRVAAPFGAAARFAGTSARNFGIGASAGFTGTPFMNRMGRVIGPPTFAHRLGTMAGTAGKMGVGIGKLIGRELQADLQLLRGFRRFGHNMSLGFMGGVTGQHKRWTTIGARVGSALGVGTRGIGRGALGIARLGLINAPSPLNAVRLAGAAASGGARFVGHAASNLMSGGNRLASNVGGAVKGAASGMMNAGAQGAKGFMQAMGMIRSSVNSTVHYITARFRKAGYDLEYVGRRMALGITLPIAAIGFTGTKAFARFDDAMHTSIALMSNVGDAAREAMEQTTFSISGASRAGPSDLAGGYFQLASAGFEAAEAMKALAVVEKFAIAGAFDINSAGGPVNTMEAISKSSEALIGVQAALGMRTQDLEQNFTNLTRVGDVLTKANIVSQARVEDFADALTNKGAAALRLLNKPMEEGVAVLAAYAAQNVKGAAAGTKLDMVLRDLQRASLRNADAWRQSNLEIFDGTGQMMDLADIINMLENRLEGMSDQQKFAELTMLGFQDRSVAALKQLLGMSDAIRKYRQQLDQADGAMKKVSDERMKSFTSQMMVLRNNIVIAGIGIGRVLAPALMSLNQWFTKVLKSWNALSSVIRKWVVMLALAVATIGPLLIILGFLISTISRVSSSFYAMGKAALMITVGPLIMMGAVVLKIVGTMLEFAATITMVALRLTTQLAVAIGSTLIGALTTAASMIMAVISGLMQMTAIAGPIGLLIGVIFFFVGAWTALIAIGSAITVTFGRVVAVFTSIGAGITSLVGRVKSAAIWLADMVMQIKGPSGLVEALRDAATSASGFGKTFAEVMKQAWLAGVGFMENFTENMDILFKWLKDNGPNLFNQIKRNATVAFEDIKFNVSVVFQAISRIITEFTAFAAIEFENMWIKFENAAKYTLATVISSMQQWAIDVAKLMASAFSGGMSPQDVFDITVFWTNMLIPKDTKKHSNEITETLTEIVENAKRQFRMRDIGFDLDSLTLPEFNFNIPQDKIPEVVDPIKKAAGAVAQLNDEVDELNQPIVATFQTRGLDALIMGTGEAFREIMNFQTALGRPMATPAIARQGAAPAQMAEGMGGGGAAAQLGLPMAYGERMMAHQAGRAEKKEAYAAMKASRRANYMAGKRKRPARIAALPNDSAPAIGTKEILANPPPENIPAPADSPQENLKELIELIKAQNEMMADAPDIELSPAALGDL
jgi:TP901 family phage tail tape measure protein